MHANKRILLGGSRVKILDGLDGSLKRKTGLT